MDNLFLALLFLSLIGWGVGLIKPHWVKLPTRKIVNMVFGCGALVFFALTGITAPSAQNTQSAPNVGQVAQSATSSSTLTTKASSTPQTQTIASNQCAAAAADALAKVTALYSQAYRDGKKVLGTTQYSDAYTALNALTVSGSAASNFSGWKKVWSTYEPNFYKQIVNGYSVTSNCYYQTGTNEPDSLANWRDDMAQADSDISVWSGDATGWQIQTTSTAELMQAEAKIDADFTAIQKDISDLKNGQ